MKKTICAFMLALTMSIGVNTAIAAKNPTKDGPGPAKKEITAEQQVKLDKLVARVNEIKEMDKSDLTRSEKKALRHELKDMKSQANAIGGGVYLSVGAIIIIILVLILVL